MKERHGLASVEPLHAGVFTVVQRFRSDLGLYVNLHSLVTITCARIVPPAVPAPVLQFALGLTGAANNTSGEPAEASPRPRRLAWAGLLARVFAIDVTVCRKCGGRMRILEVVSDPDDTVLALRRHHRGPILRARLRPRRW